MPRSRPAFLTLALALLVVAGCSSPEKSDIVVAKVADREITLDYFERKMNTMNPEFVPADINAQSGREELLDIMINKEVMAIKAEELGMDADGTANEQAEMVSLLKAVNKMREDVVAPAQNPTEEQLLDYYEKLPRRLTVSYMLFDWEDEALEAKRLVEGGELWNDVARRLEAGAPNAQTDDYTLTMSYGTIADDLEYKVFQLPSGQVSDPIDSIYGWFLIRVDDVTMDRVQPFEDIRDKVRESVVKQDSALLVVDFIEEVLAKYDFQIGAEALKTVWEALPEDASLNPPTPTEDLTPLEIDPVHYDEVLVSYADRTIDLREYQDVYNQSSVFARPRLERGLGAFRRALKEDAVREVMQLEARARGYMDVPEIQDEYKTRLEQSMVSKLHAELISDEIEISPAELDAYWQEHSEDWYRPARRRIKALVAETQTEALSARIEIQGGSAFGDVVKRYCIESDLKNNAGDFGTIVTDSPSPFRDIAWSLDAPGDVSAPVELGEGQWAVVRLEEILDAYQPDYEDVKLDVGRRAKAEREEELFLEKVAEWREDYAIETWPEHLMKATYEPVAPKPQSIPVRVGS